MKYFLDTEFLEGKQKDYTKRSLYWLIALFVIGIAITFSYRDLGFVNVLLSIQYTALALLFLILAKISKSPNTIDLISIGIVSEDIDKTLMPPHDVYSESVKTSREYYAVSKDFNLKEAWNRFHINDTMPDSLAFGKHKEYWIRENVLKTIFIDFLKLETEYLMKQRRMIGYAPLLDTQFTYKNFKRLLKRFGTTNDEIAEEILVFCSNGFFDKGNSSIPFSEKKKYEFPDKPKFYSYFADYDWVTFCWLFGKMIELPKSFPMYCNDLKQTMDELPEFVNHKEYGTPVGKPDCGWKDHYLYPKKENDHNALADARHHKAIHKFLESI